jgi:hypothetical protein
MLATGVMSSPANITIQFLRRSRIFVMSGSVSIHPMPIILSAAKINALDLSHSIATQKVTFPCSLSARKRVDDEYFA